MCTGNLIIYFDIRCCVYVYIVCMQYNVFTPFPPFSAFSLNTFFRAFFTLLKWFLPLYTRFTFVGLTYIFSSLSSLTRIKHLKFFYITLEAAILISHEYCTFGTRNPSSTQTVKKTKKKKKNLRTVFFFLFNISVFI